MSAVNDLGESTNLRSIDIRLLLPTAPAKVALAGQFGQLTSAFRRAGISVIAADSLEAVDALIGDSPSISPAQIARARAAVSFGRKMPRGIPRHWKTARYFASGEQSQPTLLANLSGGAPHYLSKVWAQPDSLSGKAKGLALRSSLSALATSLVVASEEPCVPNALRIAANAIGSEIPESWFFQLGDGDDMQRVVAHAFLGTETRPSWVAKFSRMPNAASREVKEARILGILEARVPDLARQTPTILGSFEINGASASVERAAPGRSLNYGILRNPERQQKVIEDLLQWTVKLGSSSLVEPDSGSTKDDLHQVLAEYGAQRLADHIARVPRCIAHRDLGTWNVHSDEGAFTVLDWESATDSGLPTTDVAYLVTDVLVNLHGPSLDSERPKWCADLWRGDLEQSPIAWKWVVTAAAGAGISTEAAAALVTTSWLEHGLSHRKRSGHISDGPAAYGYLGLVAQHWVNDPKLGIDWKGLHPHRNG